MAHFLTAKVCKYHLQGTCTRGTHCSFVHPASATANARDDAESHRSPVVCQYFKDRSCVYGAHCRFEHPSELETTTQSTKKPCIFYQRNNCSKGSACLFAHNPSMSSFPSVVSDNTVSKTKPFGPCRFFSQGRCMKGSACTFPHIPSGDVRYETQKGLEYAHNNQSNVRLPDLGHIQDTVCKDTRRSSTESTTVPSPLTTKTSENDTVVPPTLTEAASLTHSETIGRTRIIFGPGAAVKQIITPFESCRMTVFNLPHDISQAALIDVLARFGEMQKVVINMTSDLKQTIAHVEFADPSEAANAVDELDGFQHRAQTLRAQLDMRAVQSGAATLRSSKIKISWFAPTRRAWAHYNSIAFARRSAERLNGCTIGDRKISAKFQTPSPRQRESFSIALTGLDSNISSDSLQRLCSADSATIGDMTYDRSKGINIARSLLESYGPVETFETLPNDGKHAKLRAFVQFGTADAAQDAVKGLNGRPQEHLGKSPLFLELIHSVRYNVPARQFSVLKDSIDVLREESGDCTVRCYDRDSDGAALDLVCIRLYSVDAKALGQSKAVLERLLAGDVVKSDGEVFWDDFFQTAEGQSFISHIGETMGVYIRCDSRKRNLHMVGNADRKGGAYSVVIAKGAELAAERHVLRLDKTDLRRVLQNYEKLQELVGVNKISLDVLARTLTVLGDDTEVDQVRDTVRALKSDINITHGSPDGVECPVCFCEPSNSTELPCGHSYCKPCLLHFLSSVPETKTFPVKCIADDGKCAQALPIAVFRDVLPPGADGRLYAAAFRAYIHQRPQEFRYCPTADCQTIYRPAPAGTVLRCPACLARICPACHVEFHEGLTCCERTDGLSGGREAYQRWRAENDVKACPSCGADLQKNGGCNHIKCILCGVHMCWVCMKTFTDQGSDGGIYAHMVAAHGGIGI